MTLMATGEIAPWIDAPALASAYVTFLDGLLPQLRAFGLDIITHNCEYAGSQFETNYGPALNIAAADKAFAFKNGMKELAHRHGLIASFMTDASAPVGFPDFAAARARWPSHFRISKRV